jgi:hypothetical protein
MSMSTKGTSMNRARQVGIRVAVSAAMIVLGGCEKQEDDDGDRSEVATESQALLGTVTYGGDCTAADRSFLDKAMHYGRTAATSPVFQQCLDRAVRTGAVGVGPYRAADRSKTGCQNPFADQALAVQIDRLVQAARGGAGLNIACTGATSGNAAAALGSYDMAGPEQLAFSGWLRAVASDHGYAKQAAGIIWHEAMHQRGYTHGGNSQADAKTACGFDTATDAQWHYQQNTLPYIVGACMQTILERSSTTCGSLDLGKRVRLLSDLDSSRCLAFADPHDVFPDDGRNARDFNYDRLPDIVWHNAATGETQIWAMSNSSRIGRSTVQDNRDGSVTRIGWPFRIVGLEDFDQDGSADIVWHHALTGEVQIWFMNGSNLVRRATLDARDGGPTMATAPWRLAGTGDFNRDGNADLLWHNNLTGDVVAWYLRGSSRVGGGYVSSSNGAVPRARDPWNVVAAADFNQDYGADIVWHNRQTGQTRIWFMNGTTLASYVDVDANRDGGGHLVRAPWSIVGAGDYNGDFDTDLLWHNDATGEVQIWYLNRASRIGRATVDANRDGGGALVGKPWQIVPRFSRLVASDFDQDGSSDVLWRDTQGQTAIWFMSGGTLAGQAYPGGVDPGLTWKIQGSGDFDGDGHADVLWRAVNGQTAIWFMRGGTIAGQAYPGGVDPGGAWTIQGTGDFDGDGRSDILWRDVNGQTAIWFMHAGTIAAQAYPGGTDPGRSWTIRGAGDFDGDGRSDILWRDVNGQTAIWFMHAGTIAAQAFPGGRDPSRSWWIRGVGDFDGDGRSDILWRDLNGQTAIWFMHGGTLAGQAFPGGVDPGGAWQIQGAGDFDGDGRSDVLWRDNQGQTAIWFMHAGTIAGQSFPGGRDPGRAWDIQPRPRA